MARSGHPLHRNNASRRSATTGSRPCGASTGTRPVRASRSFLLRSAPGLPLDTRRRLTRQNPLRTGFGFAAGQARQHARQHARHEPADVEKSSPSRRLTRNTFRAVSSSNRTVSHLGGSPQTIQPPHGDLPNLAGPNMPQQPGEGGPFHRLDDEAGRTPANRPLLLGRPGSRSRFLASDVERRAGPS